MTITQIVKTYLIGATTNSISVYLIGYIDENKETSTMSVVMLPEQMKVFSEALGVPIDTMNEHGNIVHNEKGHPEIDPNSELQECGRIEIDIQSDPYKIGTPFDEEGTKGNFQRVSIE